MFQDGLVEAIVPASSGRRSSAPPCQPQLCNRTPECAITEQGARWAGRLARPWCLGPPRVMRSEPVGVTLPPSKPCPPQETDAGQRDGMVQAGASSSPRIPPRRIGSNHFSSQQFQALFHSLFKVLSIFPSQYLFAIGLSPIFSFRWSLPPDLACIPKQADSQERPYPAQPTESKTGL